MRNSDLAFLLWEIWIDKSPFVDHRRAATAGRIGPITALGSAIPCLDLLYPRLSDLSHAVTSELRRMVTVFSGR